MVSHISNGNKTHPGLRSSSVTSLIHLLVWFVFYLPSTAQPSQSSMMQEASNNPMSSPREQHVLKRRRRKLLSLVSTVAIIQVSHVFAATQPRTRGQRYRRLLLQQASVSSSSTQQSSPSNIFGFNAAVFNSITAPPLSSDTTASQESALPLPPPKKKCAPVPPAKTPTFGFKGLPFPKGSKKGKGPGGLPAPVPPSGGLSASVPSVSPIGLGVSGQSATSPTLSPIQLGSGGYNTGNSYSPVASGTGGYSTFSLSLSPSQSHVAQGAEQPTPTRSPVIVPTAPVLNVSLVNVTNTANVTNTVNATNTTRTSPANVSTHGPAPDWTRVGIPTSSPTSVPPTPAPAPHWVWHPPTRRPTAEPTLSPTSRATLAPWIHWPSPTHPPTRGPAPAPHWTWRAPTRPPTTLPFWAPETPSPTLGGVQLAAEPPTASPVAQFPVPTNAPASFVAPTLIVPTNAPVAPTVSYNQPVPTTYPGSTFIVPTNSPVAPTASYNQPVPTNYPGSTFIVPTNYPAVPTDAYNQPVPTNYPGVSEGYSFAPTYIGRGEYTKGTTSGTPDSLPVSGNPPPPPPPQPPKHPPPPTPPKGPPPPLKDCPDPGPPPPPPKSPKITQAPGSSGSGPQSGSGTGSPPPPPPPSGSGSGPQTGPGTGTGNGTGWETAGAPTTAPGNVSLCASIAAGNGPISGYAMSLHADFVLVVTEDPTTVYKRVQDYLQQHLAPTLVGCSRRRLLLRGLQSGATGTGITNALFDVSENVNLRTYLMQNLEATTYFLPDCSHLFFLYYSNLHHPNSKYNLPSRQCRRATLFQQSKPSERLQPIRVSDRISRLLLCY